MTLPNFDNTIVLTSDALLPPNGTWNKGATYVVSGATVTSAKPLSELTAQLGGLGGVLGGAAGGSSSGSGASGSGSSGPSSKALQAYSNCLQKADPSKAAELQKCAKLLK